MEQVSNSRAILSALPLGPPPLSRSPYTRMSCCPSTESALFSTTRTCGPPEGQGSKPLLAPESRATRLEGHPTPSKKNSAASSISPQRELSPCHRGP